MFVDWFRHLFVYSIQFDSLWSRSIYDYLSFHSSAFLAQPPSTTTIHILFIFRILSSATLIYAVDVCVCGGIYSFHQRRWMKNREKKTLHTEWSRNRETNKNAPRSLSLFLRVFTSATLVDFFLSEMNLLYFGSLHCQHTPPQHSSHTKHRTLCLWARK